MQDGTRHRFRYRAVPAGRWALTESGAGGGFSTWARRGQVRVALEDSTPAAWLDGLLLRGHDAAVAPGNYGHAHVIAARDGVLEGASDPRALTGATAAY